MDVARKIAHEVPYKLGELEKTARARHAERSGSRQISTRLAHLARPMFTIADDRLDRNKFLLNVDNGTMDLRTSELRPHDPRDFITKIVPNWTTRGEVPDICGFRPLDDRRRQGVQSVSAPPVWLLPFRRQPRAGLLFRRRARSHRKVLCSLTSCASCWVTPGLQANMDSFLMCTTTAPFPPHRATARGSRRGWPEPGWF